MSSRHARRRHCASGTSPADASSHPPLVRSRHRRHEPVKPGRWFDEVADDEDSADASALWSRTVWQFGRQMGVESAYEQPHRKDPQVVGTRKEVLIVFTPRTA